MEKEFKFLDVAEKLKQETRHCWSEKGRQESVAEHSWRLSLMVWRYADKLDRKVDVLECMKMATVHDLPEAIVGDVPLLYQNEQIKKDKDKRELEAMINISDDLNDQNGQEMLDLYREYEKQESYESKYVKAMDKLEAFIQHNQSPLSTWEFKEKQMLFQDKYLRKHCEFDSFMKKFADEVIEIGIRKLKDAGEDVNEIKKSALE